MTDSALRDAVADELHLRGRSREAEYIESPFFSREELRFELRKYKDLSPELRAAIEDFEASFV